jgi:hypothetical protein
MDPLTIFLFTLVSVVSAGSGTAVARRLRKRRRERLREALLKKLPTRDRYLSVFDLFWDLGVSDFALEIMAAQRLLPHQPDDMEALFASLEDLLATHGNYAALLDELLDSIQLFYLDHLAAGARRMLPSLQLPGQKLLPLPDSMRSNLSPPDPDTLHVDDMPDGLLLDVDAEERWRIREDRRVTSTALVITSDTEGMIDLDALLATGGQQLLRSLLQGRLGQQIKRLAELRELRARRAELDARLTTLYRHWALVLQGSPALVEPLYDLTRRWEREALRIEAMERAAAWNGKPWALTASILTEEARILARYLARTARKNADELLAAIRTHASRGDEAMAGYLVYVNRHAFFAGRGDAHQRLVLDIELATAAVQAELHSLRSRGVL